MTDFTKVCWSCQKLSMVDKGVYHQCSECGATWNEPPWPYHVALVTERDDATGLTKYKAPVIRKHERR